jgi:hypothetical protein
METLALRAAFAPGVLGFALRDGVDRRRECRVA